MQIASELFTLPKCLPDYLLCAQPALCNMGFFWISNLPSVRLLDEFNKGLFARPGQQGMRKLRFPWSLKERTAQAGVLTGTQGCLCSKGHCPFLLFITWSKYEKVTLWMGKTKGVWCQAVWNFNASYWQKLSRKASGRAPGELGTMRCYILSCQGTATRCPVGS